ncbi:imv protein, entry/fusion complex component [Pteropox virus]|uniref:Imv protein, entry/fusion complex component n=1 Tax=Pteropox virus TaxID=1873698 RepID=A0A1B1MRN7_9POXV|nr:imv protein, entry/fusion complex component [Pteropox virus]ANS71209.1 imv protein, entry/fusion complex component [Pteropox virus]
MDEDINEAALGQLLKRISQCSDTELGFTAVIIHELINTINLKLLDINKKAKKTKSNKNNAQERNSFSN